MKIITKLTEVEGDVYAQSALKELLTLTHSKNQKYPKIILGDTKLIKDKSGVWTLDKDNFKLDILEGKEFSSYLQLSTMNLLFGIPREMLFRNNEFTSLFRRTKLLMTTLTKEEIDYMSFFGTFENSLEYFAKKKEYVFRDPYEWEQVYKAELEAMEGGIGNFYDNLKKALPPEYRHLAELFKK